MGLSRSKLAEAPAKRLLLVRPSAASQQWIGKERVSRGKNKEGSHKGRRERRYIGLNSKLWGFTAAGSDAARRLSCGGPGTKAKLFLHTEAKALPAQYAS